MPRQKKELTVSLEEATKLKKTAEREKELDKMYDDSIDSAMRIKVAVDAFVEVGFTREEALKLLINSMKK